MIYRQHANRNIVSSFSSKKGRNPFGLFGMIAVVIICIVFFFILKKPLGHLLFGIRQLVVPSSVGMIVLDPNAVQSKVGALEIENNELKNLLIRAGVRIPGFDNTAPDFLPDGDITSTTSDSAVAGSTTTDDVLAPNQKPDHIRLRGNELIASVLVRPPQSPYDALVISAGTNDGIAIGDQVYAFSGFPIGEVISAESKRSTVRLFSSPGSKIEVLIGTSTAAVMAEGRGGGNFFLKLPKVTEISPGDIVVRNFLPPEVFSTIASVDSAEGEAYIHAYFKLPININSLVYVLVKKNSSQ